MPCVFPVLGIKILGFVTGGRRPPQGGPPRNLFFTRRTCVFFGPWVGWLVRSGKDRLGDPNSNHPEATSSSPRSFLIVRPQVSAACFEIRVCSWPLGPAPLFAGKTGWMATFLEGAFITSSLRRCSAPFLGTAIGGRLDHAAGKQAMFGLHLVGLVWQRPICCFRFLSRWAELLPRPGARGWKR